MTDVPDGSGQVPRRPSRVSDGGAPVSGALAIVLAVVAVVAGFLILRSISDSGSESADFPAAGNGASAAAAGDTDATGSAPVGSAVPTLPTTTTEPPVVTEGASVIVANANSVGGSASAMTRALETGPGFTMVDPVNASATVGDLEESAIYYDTTMPAAQSVADSVARVLGGVGTVAPLQGTPPTADGQMNGAGVLVMLGNDKAGKTLAELSPTTAAATPVTNPPIAATTPTTAAG